MSPNQQALESLRATYAARNAMSNAHKKRHRVLRGHRFVERVAEELRRELGEENAHRVAVYIMTGRDTNTANEESRK